MTLDGSIPAFIDLLNSVPSTCSTSTASNDSSLTAKQSATSSQNLVSETELEPQAISETPENISNETVR
ncbi:hypothetical protein OUZ56_018361 [Daphnia magna]|uniref:Uncharacterized protein n=1 Tax=Daphnia magna TaxID=35525 RepID=A0ABQ9Z8M3_9CRUS|nr:hypothetical protein OUZ56_018361 [Daphnia magna]